MVADRHKQLVKLGADALATALLDLANYIDDADSIVERLLASPKENAKTFKKRLSSLKRRRHFISRGESGAYARELTDLLKTLEASESDSRVGVESVAAFYGADHQIFDKCDDSNGSLGDVFKVEAANLFVSFASRCEDKDWLLELVITLNQENGYVEVRPACGSERYLSSVTRFYFGQSSVKVLSPWRKLFEETGFSWGKSSRLARG